MKRLLIVMLIVWLAPTVCVAQQGVLRGKVTETTSGLLPGVSVEACGSASSGECRSAVTDGWGYYLLDDLLVGTYTVTMSLPGFSSFVREGVEVLVGDAPYLHGQLTVGALAGEAMPPKENSLTANSPAKGVLGPSVGFWVFDGTAGQVVSVAASSDAFDPEAELLSPTGERLGSDDDSGPGTNALLTETLPATGRYEVRVRAVDGGTGAYRLAVRTVPEASLALNTQVAGALDDRSPVGRWTFDGTAGQVVSVAASSDAFDPEAELLSPTGKRLGSDDDSGPGTNALLTETLPATGRYEVRVHAVDGGAGAYHLAVRTVPTVRLAVDTPVAGALDDQAPLGLWTFAGTAGQVVNVSVASEVFAPFIELLLPTGEHLTADGNAAPVPTRRLRRPCRSRATTRSGWSRSTPGQAPTAWRSAQRPQLSGPWKRRELLWSTAGSTRPSWRCGRQPRERLRSTRVLRPCLATRHRSVYGRLRGRQVKSQAWRWPLKHSIQ